LNEAIPAISVVVATLARPDACARAVASILASLHHSFELVLVDQNAGDLTRRSLAGLLNDPRLRLIQIAPGGVSAARNRGTAHARADLIAYTDDDCEVGPAWLSAIEQALRSSAAPGIVLGQVTAGRHDSTAGLIPVCARQAFRITTLLRERPNIEVMAACMGITRSAWQSLNGFAEWMGPGTDIPAGEDYDLAVRALLAGQKIVEAPAAVAIHHGFRTWAQAPALIESYAHGIALVLGLRLGRRPALLSWCLVSYAGGFLQARSLHMPAIRAAGHPDRRLIAFAKGLRKGLVESFKRQTAV
jgi:GT2 family glycosyltransferase